MLSVGSLFSGVGGFEKGLEATGGFETIWQCEIEPYPSAVLKRHWPNVPNLGDIIKVRWEDVERPDVICGGFPCTNISVAGKGEGIKEGNASGLWSHFAKAIGVLQPRYALIENVPMLAKRGLNIVLADLAKEGYDAEWFTLRASDVGAPHRRERIFIIAYPTSQRCTAGQCDREGGQVLPTEKWEMEKDEQERNRWLTGTSEDNDASDIISDGIQRFNEIKIPRFAEFQRFKNCLRVEDFSNRPDIPQPLVRGGDDGVPNRIHRIKCLGNAVVPQVAQVIGEMILEMERLNWGQGLDCEYAEGFCEV